MKRPFPTGCSHDLEVYATRDAMGKAAARDAAAAIKETIYDDTALSGFIWIETP